MSVKNSNELSMRLRSIINSSAQHNREISLDSLDFQNDKTFKLSDITDVYVESGKQQRFLSFSSNPSSSHESIIIKQLSNDYDQLLESVIDMSCSEVSSSDISYCKKETVLAPPRAIGTPDPHLATFNRVVPEKKAGPSNTSEIYGPTMPTEGDVFEVDLNRTVN